MKQKTLRPAWIIFSVSYPNSWLLTAFDSSGQALELPLNAIDQTTFPVTDTLSCKLRDVARAVDGQQQFLIISGLDPRRYNDKERVILHAGLSSHVGSKRGMPGREGGDMTVLRRYPASESVVGKDLIKVVRSYRGHERQFTWVHKTVSWAPKSAARHRELNQAILVIQNANSRPQPFHTDHGDLVSLFTLSTSQSGGAFYLADTTTVYNDLKAARPKLAKALLDDWIMTRYVIQAAM